MKKKKNKRTELEMGLKRPESKSSAIPEDSRAFASAFSTLTGTAADGENTPLNPEMDVHMPAGADLPEQIQSIARVSIDPQGQVSLRSQTEADDSQNVDPLNVDKAPADLNSASGLGGVVVDESAAVRVAATLAPVADATNAASTNAASGAKIQSEMPAVSTKTKLHTIANTILVGLVALLCAGTIYVTHKYNLLNFYNINKTFYISVVLLIAILVSLVYRKKAKIFVTIFSIILIAGLSFALYQMNVAISLFAKFNENSNQVIAEMVVLAKESDSRNELKEWQIAKISAPLAMAPDGDNIQTMLDHLRLSFPNLKINFDEVPSYMAAVEAVRDGRSDLMIFNKAFAGLIKDIYPNFMEELKPVYEFAVKTDASDQNGNQNNSEAQPAGVEPPKSSQQLADQTSFNIYISGIDTVGSIQTVSRSDVNILMTVNTKTREIMLTNTPRDTYVKISGRGQNQFDKLTHAGLYGVEASADALGNLYGVKIDYYARVNFTTFINLIDIIGGIDVYNEQPFVSRHGHYSFPAGLVHLDANQALSFVRERYAFAAGDLARGRNHEKVISAIIKKLTSKEVLVNYQEILAKLAEAVQTNIKLEELSYLVSRQIQANALNFKVESQELHGFGHMDLPSFAMPGYRVYTMEVDPASLDKLKNVIAMVYRGETRPVSGDVKPTQPEVTGTPQAVYQVQPLPRPTKAKTTASESKPQSVDSSSGLMPHPGSNNSGSILEPNSALNPNSTLNGLNPGIINTSGGAGAEDDSKSDVQNNSGTGGMDSSDGNKLNLDPAYNPSGLSPFDTPSLP